LFSGVLADDCATATTLRVLGAAFAGARRGEGDAVVVPEALIDDAVERARTSSLGVLHAGAVDGARRRFALASRLCGPAVEALPADAREAVFGGAASLARPLFAGDEPHRAEASELALVHGLYWLTINLAARTPLAIVAGGVVAADAASLRWLRTVAQRAFELPVALVVDAPVVR
jgi:hypothetical protein